jgi:[ribosomal protein S5]-alanine N-acetyltransferase
MKIFVETERTLIREMQEEDLPGLFEMDSDPEVHRYIAQRPLKTMDEVKAMLQFVQQQYTDNGVGRWAVIEKATGDCIGWTGFKLMKEIANGRINHYDFGYRFKRAAWGKGFATETGRASLQYGVEKMGLKPVYAMTDVNNAASRHVLEKLGFLFVEIFEYDGPAQWRTPNNKMATWYEFPEDEPLNT